MPIYKFGDMVIDPERYPWGYDSQSAIANLDKVLWLDGADLATITHSENAVSQWADKSGAGNHAEQSQSPKPTIGTLVNGRNTISFDGTQYLSISTNGRGLRAFTIGTVIIIYRWQSSSDVSGGVISRTHSLTTAPGPWDWHVGVNSGGASRLRIWSDGTGTTFPFNDPVNTMSLLTAQFDGSTVKIWNQDQLFSSTAYASQINAGEPLWIGVYNGSGTSTVALSSLVGDIGEIICFSHILSDSQLQKAWAYLAMKWGI